MMRKPTTQKMVPPNGHQRTTRLGKSVNNVRSSATTGVTAQKRKGGRVKQASSTHDAIDKASSESLAKGLRNKRQKHAAQSASVGRREGLRRSGRTDAKQDLDAADDSVLNEISAPHIEIKAMVRDILFKDIIDRQHDAEMTSVKEGINGICNATGGIMSSGATASMKGGRGIKQSGSGVDDDSSNVIQRGRDGATSSPASREGNTDTSHISQPHVHTPHFPTPSMISNLRTNLTRFHQDTEATVKMTPENHRARQVWQMSIIQSLGLLDPSEYPVGWNREAAATNRQL
ncbi:hypothetical protein HU200_062406 [Digitaria exilis]|uniref:Uncharacterized protein n=1 Tax=Digitaria exilis TaxID=1010633 RepID=A0A835A5D1_9POAL|nr:hypothetical protein HU200_062406 [Digitaria exilis]